MTKADLAQAICERVGAYSKKEAAELVDLTLEVMRSALERGSSVKISGFGHFALRSKGPRPGRNPRTGQEMTISARRVVVFRPSPSLRSALNDGS